MHELLFRTSLFIVLWKNSQQNNTENIVDIFMGFPKSWDMHAIASIMSISFLKTTHIHVN